MIRATVILTNMEASTRFRDSSDKASCRHGKLLLSTVDRLGREAVKACLHKAQGLRAICVQHLGPNGFLQYYGLQSARNSFTVVLAARCCARLKQNCIRLKQENFNMESSGVDWEMGRGASWSGEWSREGNELEWDDTVGLAAPAASTALSSAGHSRRAALSSANRGSGAALRSATRGAGSTLSPTTRGCIWQKHRLYRTLKSRPQVLRQKWHGKAPRKLHLR